MSVQAKGEIQVDIEILKKPKEERDALLYHLEYYQVLCTYNKEVYQEYARKAKTHNDLLSVNALVLSTVLGILSSIGDKPNIKYGNMVLSAYLALISGVQRFFGFAEKSENARIIAKSFDKIQRDIGQVIMYVNSEAITIDARTFTKSIEEIERNIASVSEQAIQSPPEFERSSSYIEFTEKEKWGYGKYRRSNISDIIKTVQRSSGRVSPKKFSKADEPENIGQELTEKLKNLK
jgi:hypothetical protein